MKGMIWTILGFSVAIIAAFCVTVAELLVGQPIFEDHRRYVAAALAMGGVAAWFCGRVLNVRRQSDESSGGETTSRFILFDLRYWGPMLLALGVITLFIRPLKHNAKTAPLAATPTPSPKAILPLPSDSPPQPVVVKTPVAFPKLKMQGVIFREPGSFAIINGHSYAVGDRLGEVLVKSIHRASVILELQGELHVLKLD
jgi:hypothetical protein